MQRPGMSLDISHLSQQSAATAQSSVEGYQNYSTLPLVSFTQAEFEQAGLLSIAGLPSQQEESSGRTNNLGIHHTYDLHDGNASSPAASSFNLQQGSDLLSQLSLAVPVGQALPYGPDNDLVEGSSAQAPSHDAQQQGLPQWSHATEAVSKKHQNRRHQKQFRLRQKVFDANMLSAFSLCHLSC